MRTVFVVNNIHNETKSVTMLKEIISSIDFVLSYKGKNGRNTVIDREPIQATIST